MFKQSLVLVICGILSILILPVEGQEIKFSKVEAQERPANLGEEYTFGCRFSVEKKYVPWLSDKLTKEELQDAFSQLVESVIVTTSDRLRTFLTTEVGGAIRFSQDKEGIWSVDIFGIDDNQAQDRAEVVYNVCRSGGVKMQRQHHAEQLKEQEERIDNLRMDLLSAQLHVERSEREAQKQYGGLSKEVRVSLESRKWQLEVDLAGVEARIKSVGQMHDVDVSNPRGMEEIMKIRINAQVEMAGIMAQKDKIEEILRMANEYDSQVLPHLEQLSELEYEMARTQIAHEQLQKKEPPEFEVKDNTIFVFPLKEVGK